MAEFLAETILVDCYGKAIKQRTCKGNYSLMPRFNIEMAEIPGGTAVLGSPEHEISRGDESLPGYQLKPGKRLRIRASAAAV